MRPSSDHPVVRGSTPLHSRYVNRLGAGAVVYWFGFAAELEGLDDDILVLDGWPARGTLFWPDAREVTPG